MRGSVASPFFNDVFRKRNVMYPTEVMCASREMCAFGTWYGAHHITATILHPFTDLFDGIRPLLRSYSSFISIAATHDLGIVTVVFSISRRNHPGRWSLYCHRLFASSLRNGLWLHSIVRRWSRRFVFCKMKSSFPSPQGSRRRYYGRYLVNCAYCLDKCKYTWYNDETILFYAKSTV